MATAPTPMRPATAVANGGSGPVVDCATARAALLACPPGERPEPAFDAHVASCTACRPWRQRLRGLDGALGALPFALAPAPSGGPPPPFERIARHAGAAARRRR